MAAPKIIPYDVELRSVNPVRSFDRPKAYTNDLNSVRFQFKVLDLTSEELTTATAVTLIYMRDGSFFANPSTDVSRVGNIFSYLLKENEGNHAGVAQIQLVVTVDGMDIASQLFDFEIINGLETKVAQEVMIYDWTTLTRDAQDYIDQFVSNEATRQQQFADAQTARTNTFTQFETDRTTAFNASEDARTVTFNGSESIRTTAFNTAENGRTTAETGRVTAESNRVSAENGRTTAESNRVTAESNRVTAESGRVTAESGRVIAESERATTFAGYNARITGVESDVNANGTNLVTNGDFSNGTTGWTPNNGTVRVENGQLIYNEGTTSAEHLVQSSLPTAILNNVYYFAGYSTNARSIVLFNRKADGAYESKTLEFKGGRVSGTMIPTSLNATPLTFIRLYGKPEVYTGASTEYSFDNIFVINLTSTFGAGNEPTAEQMDGILAKFTNSWFDGTKNLFRANATLNKLMAVDARTEFEAKNGVVNGDLSNGLTGWLSYADPMTLVLNGDYIEFTPATTSGGVAQPYTTLANRKYYLRATMKATTETSGFIGLATNNVGTALSQFLIKTIDTTFSTIITPVQNFANVVFGRSAIPNQTIYLKKYVTVIDLTAAFGAGKEPTLAEMDRLMARFPNSWFDGVKPIQTIETLYQEKANKVQEAWITPTLLNGWIAGAFGTPQYMLDELGFVHLRGSIKNGVVGQAAFTLPTGYRPSSIKAWISTSGYEAFNTGFITTSGSFAANKLNTNGDTALDNISFKVGA